MPLRQIASCKEVRRDRIPLGREPVDDCRLWRLIWFASGSRSSWRPAALLRPSQPRPGPAWTYRQPLAAGRQSHGRQALRRRRGAGEGKRTPVYSLREPNARVIGPGVHDQQAFIWASSRRHHLLSEQRRPCSGHRVGGALYIGSRLERQIESEYLPCRHWLSGLQNVPKDHHGPICARLGRVVGAP
jgi:hypothetical protein